MTQLYENRRGLLVGDDPTGQNPLVAGNSFGHPASRLALVRHQFEIRSSCAASQGILEVPQGGESTAVRWLAGGDAATHAAAFEGLSALKPLSKRKTTLSSSLGGSDR